jgi:hypothetical protein
MGGLQLMRRIEMTGQIYGRLTILGETGKYVTALCTCGTTKEIFRGSVLAGYTTSCGCYQKERTSKANFKHGHACNDEAKTPTYRSWKAMLSRCRNPMRDHADRYVERGITYDPRWADFRNFLADMGERPEGLEIDRVDNNLGYSKDNCRWATHQQNCQNRGY